MIGFVAKEFWYSTMQIYRDWGARKITKHHANLPAQLTASTLICIRTQACLAAGKANCSFWAKRVHLPEPEPDDPNFPVGHCFLAPRASEEQEQELDDSDLDINACATCKSPGLSMEKMSAALFGKRTTDPSTCSAMRAKDARDDELIKRKSQLRRMMRGAVPLSLSDYLRAVANARAHEWIGDSQAISLVREAIQLKAVSLTLRARLKVHQRKPEHPINLLEGVESEEKAQWDDFFRVALASAKGPGWHPDVRKEILDALQE